MKATVHAQITAFDKNSSEYTGRSIIADSKESFNEQVTDFEGDVTYSKYFTTIVVDEVDLTPEQEAIVADHEIE